MHVEGIWYTVQSDDLTVLFWAATWVEKVWVLGAKGRPDVAFIPLNSVKAACARE